MHFNVVMDKYFVATHAKIEFFDLNGKLMYTAFNYGFYTDPQAFVVQGNLVLMSRLGISWIVPPLEQFRLRIRIHEAKKLWSFLGKSYALKSSRLRANAWEHVDQLLSDKNAPIVPVGVQRFDPSTYK